MTMGRTDYRRALRFVTEAVRNHLRRQACAHPHTAGDRFCPACGAPMEDPAAPVGTEPTVDRAVSADDVEDFITGIDPRSTRSGHHLRAITAAHLARERADRDLHVAVLRARAAGDSWRMIAVTVDMPEAEVRRPFEG